MANRNKKVSIRISEDVLYKLDELVKDSDDRKRFYNKKYSRADVITQLVKKHHEKLFAKPKKK